MARGKAGFIKPMFERAKWKVLRGDTVAVTAGRDAGASGTVLKVIRDEKRPAVIVEGCNLVRAEGGRENAQRLERRGDEIDRRRRRRRRRRLERERERRLRNSSKLELVSIFSTQTRTHRAKNTSSAPRTTRAAPSASRYGTEKKEEPING